MLKASVNHVLSCSTASEVAMLQSREILANQTFIVTGCSSGIGKACAHGLLDAGASVVGFIRKSEKNKAAMESLPGIVPIYCDLADFGSIFSAVEEFKQLPIASNIVCLVNNAGVNALPTFDKFSPGFDSTLKINCISQAYLTYLLIPLFQSSKHRDQARVVNLASESHRRIESFDEARDLPPKKENHDGLRAYAFSNLARILFTRKFADKSEVPMYSVHPGVVAGTGMLQYIGFWDFLRQIVMVAWREIGFSNFMQSAAQAARAQTYLATAPISDIKAMSGQYFSGNQDDKFNEPKEVSTVAMDSSNATAVYQFVVEQIKEFEESQGRKFDQKRFS